jgi:Recombinase
LLYVVRVSRHRLRRRAEKTRRHAAAPIEQDASPVVVRQADHVERLAYTQTQAATALGISRSTLARRVLPFVETIEIGWGTYLIPVDELERFASERRRKARADRRPSARPGRKVGLGVDVVTRIRDERAAGKSLADIAGGLNADGVPTSQGGLQWWPSTVRAVLVRSTPSESAERR